MENLNLILFVCLAIPLSMMLLLFKGQSRRVCAFLLIGMFMCVFSGEINGFVMNSAELNVQSISVNIAPLVEELAKALPIIFIVYLLKPEQQKIAEFSLAVGVGFATLENVCILINSGSISFGYAFLRAIGAGMMHGVCTLTVGLALTNIANQKLVMFSGTLAALSISVIYHSIYNMLITSKLMIVGAILPILTFAVMMTANVIKNKGIIKELINRE